jgi:hypothetical protein
MDDDESDTHKTSTTGQPRQTSHWPPRGIGREGAHPESMAMPESVPLRRAASRLSSAWSTPSTASTTALRGETLDETHAMVGIYGTDPDADGVRTGWHGCAPRTCIG